MGKKVDTLATLRRGYRRAFKEDEKRYTRMIREFSWRGGSTEVTDTIAKQRQKRVKKALRDAGITASNKDHYLIQGIARSFCFDRKKSVVTMERRNREKRDKIGNQLRDWTRDIIAQADIELDGCNTPGELELLRKQTLDTIRNRFKKEGAWNP